MLLTMHGYCYDLYLLTFPGVRDVFPIIAFRRLLINADLLPQYGQTVFVLTCSSLNHDSSTQTIRNGLSDGPLSRRRGQSLHAELNLVGSITLPDISYRRFYRRLPFGIQIGIIFQPYRHIKPHGLDESFSRFIGFYLLRVFLLNTISQYSLEGYLKITLLLYSQTLPFLKPFLENFLKKIKSL